MNHCPSPHSLRLAVLCSRGSGWRWRWRCILERGEWRPVTVQHRFVLDFRRQPIRRQHAGAQIGGILLTEAIDLGIEPIHGL